MILSDSFLTESEKSKITNELLQILTKYRENEYSDLKLASYLMRCSGCFDNAIKSFNVGVKIKSSVALSYDGDNWVIDRS